MTVDVEQLFGEIEAMSGVVNIYVDALAEIAAHDSLDPAHRAMIALRDGAAIMQERTKHRDGRLDG